MCSTIFDIQASGFTYLIVFPTYNNTYILWIKVINTKVVCTVIVHQ